ncbi:MULTISPECIES: Trm112 family protein [unclassified Janibacter]|uniref:Trm112 family protein n=1 Tax=unclassified Janibacter TaxID=2649294 RepID=UPI003D05BB85
MSTDATPTPTSGTPTMEPWLREILRCPKCRAELRDATGDAGPELVCTGQDCGLAYRVDDGIPVLLIDEARHPA